MRKIAGQRYVKVSPDNRVSSHQMGECPYKTGFTVLTGFTVRGSVVFPYVCPVNHIAVKCLVYFYKRY